MEIIVQRQIMKDQQDILDRDKEKRLGCQLLNKANEETSVSVEFVELDYLAIIPKETKEENGDVQVTKVEVHLTEGARKRRTFSLACAFSLIQHNPFTFQFCNLSKRDLTERRFIIN